MGSLPLVKRHSESSGIVQIGNSILQLPPNIRASALQVSLLTKIIRIIFKNYMALLGDLYAAGLDDCCGSFPVEIFYPIAVDIFASKY